MNIQVYYAFSRLTDLPYISAYGLREAITREYGFGFWNSCFDVV